MGLKGLNPSRFPRHLTLSKKSDLQKNGEKFYRNKSCQQSGKNQLPVFCVENRNMHDNSFLSLCDSNWLGNNKFTVRQNILNVRLTRNIFPAAEGLGENVAIRTPFESILTTALTKSTRSE